MNIDSTALDIIDVLTAPANKFLAKVSKYIVNRERVYNHLVSKLNQSCGQGSLPTFLFRYTHFHDGNKVIPHYNIKDIALIIQGPVIYKADTTINVLRLYRRFYPVVPIVLSTWLGEVDDKLRAACADIDVIIVENESPQGNDFKHVLSQMVSTCAGIKYIQEHYHVQYILKARTDQFFYRHDCLLFFKNLVETYPVYGEALQGRLVVLGHHNSYKNMPFHLCDFILFGYAADVEKFYQTGAFHGNDTKDRLLAAYRHQVVKYDLQDIYQDAERVAEINGIVSQGLLPEMYIYSSFYDRCIAPLQSGAYLQQYWQFLRDYIIVADSAALLFFWPKYDISYEENTCYRQYGSLDFITWFNSFYTSSAS